MNDRTPEATELVYAAEPSWMPALVALGLLGVITGVFVWWPYALAGALIALPAMFAMVRGTRGDLERLPRRQKLTTAVLPPVPPRKPQ
jgi:hypothetical protein